MKKAIGKSASEILEAIEKERPDLVEGLEISSSALRAAELVRAMRQAANFSQKQLAERLDVSQSQISDVERGRGKLGPSFSFVVSVAEVCGYQLSALPKVPASQEAPVAQGFSMGRMQSQAVAALSGSSSSSERQSGRTTAKVIRDKVRKSLEFTVEGGVVYSPEMVSTREIARSMGQASSASVKLVKIIDSLGNVGYLPPTTLMDANFQCALGSGMPKGGRLLNITDEHGRVFFGIPSKKKQSRKSQTR